MMGVLRHHVMMLRIDEADGKRRWPELTYVVAIVDIDKLFPFEGGMFITHPAITTTMSIVTSSYLNLEFLRSYDLRTKALNDAA